MTDDLLFEDDPRPKRKKKIGSAEQHSAFEQARKAWPNRLGIRGHDTEFANFVRRHRDWAEVVYDLYPAIMIIINRRQQAKSKKQFVPAWQLFRTWINQRGWEEAEE